MSRCNGDFRTIIDHRSLLKYLLKYVSKYEKSSLSCAEVIKRMSTDVNDDQFTSKKFVN